MKKIVLLALAAVIMAGCVHKYETVPDKRHLEYEGWVVVEIDSCEYIGTAYSDMRDMFAHKGNCKFCKERRKAEMEELVVKLKEK